MSAYVTTTDCCSNCGAKLDNAETARLNWQKEANRLETICKNLERKVAEYSVQLEQAQSNQLQREVQLKKALEELSAEKALREQAQRERDEAIKELGMVKLENTAILNRLQRHQPTGSPPALDGLGFMDWILSGVEEKLKERDSLQSRLLASEAALLHADQRIQTGTWTGLNEHNEFYHAVQRAREALKEIAHA